MYKQTRLSMRNYGYMCERYSLNYFYNPLLTPIRKSIDNKHWHTRRFRNGRPGAVKLPKMKKNFRLNFKNPYFKSMESKEFKGYQTEESHREVIGEKLEDQIADNISSSKSSSKPKSNHLSDSEGTSSEQENIKITDAIAASMFNIQIHTVNTYSSTQHLNKKPEFQIPSFDIKINTVNTYSSTNFVRSMSKTSNKSDKSSKMSESREKSDREIIIDNVRSNPIKIKFDQEDANEVKIAVVEKTDFEKQVEAALYGIDLDKEEDEEAEVVEAKIIEKEAEPSIEEVKQPLKDLSVEEVKVESVQETKDDIIQDVTVEQYKTEDSFKDEILEYDIMYFLKSERHNLDEKILDNSPSAQEDELNNFVKNQLEGLEFKIPAYNQTRSYDVRDLVSESEEQEVSIQAEVEQENQSGVEVKAEYSESDYEDEEYDDFVEPLAMPAPTKKATIKSQTPKVTQENDSNVEVQILVNEEMIRLEMLNFGEAISQIIDKDSLLNRGEGEMQNIIIEFAKEKCDQHFWNAIGVEKYVN